MDLESEGQQRKLDKKSRRLATTSSSVREGNEPLKKGDLQLASGSDYFNLKLNFFHSYSFFTVLRLNNLSFISGRIVERVDWLELSFRLLCSSPYAIVSLSPLLLCPLSRYVELLKWFRLMEFFFFLPCLRFPVLSFLGLLSFLMVNSRSLSEEVTYNGKQEMASKRQRG